MKTFTPRAQPSSRIFALTLCLLMFGVAGIAARELWTKRTGTALESWLSPIFELISRAQYQPWMLPVGILAIVVGLIFMFSSLKPRRATHQALAGEPTLWVRNVDIARMCTAVAERVPGVAVASTYASPRVVTVTVTGNSGDEPLPDRVRLAVHDKLAKLAKAPTLHVRMGGLT